MSKIPSISSRRSRESRGSQYDPDREGSDEEETEYGGEHKEDRGKNQAHGEAGRKSQTSGDRKSGAGTTHRGTDAGTASDEEGEETKHKKKSHKAKSYFDADGHPVTSSYEGIKYDRDGQRVLDAELSTTPDEEEQEEIEEEKKRSSKSTQASPAAKVGPDGQPLTQTKCEQLLRERCKQMLPCCPGGKMRFIADLNFKEFFFANGIVSCIVFCL